MPYTINGIGTTYYGRREPWEDGSYITTEWLVFLYLPILPIGSFRVRRVRESQSFFGFEIDKEYYVTRVPLHWKQIGNIYLISMAAIGGIIAASNVFRGQPTISSVIPSSSGVISPEPIASDVRNQSAQKSSPPSPLTSFSTSATPTTQQPSRRIANEMKTPTFTPAKPIHERPKVADNGSVFPSTSSYVKGYPKYATAGLSSLTIDNSQNSSDALIKVVIAGSKKSVKPIRVVFVKAHESFTIKEITAGNYAIKHLNLDEGSYSLSEPFELKEDKTDDGTIHYTNILITLYKVQNGNMHSTPIDESEF